jgi:hypothetical protein
LELLHVGGIRPAENKDPRQRDELLYDIRTARMLGQLLGRRTTGPIVLSTRVAPDDGTTPTRDVGPANRRRPPRVTSAPPLAAGPRTTCATPASSTPARTAPPKPT